MNAAACTEIDGVPVAVTGGDDEAVRVWDLHTGQPVGQPLTGHTSAVNAVACAMVDGVPVAVTGGSDGTVRVWDLHTRAQTTLLTLDSPHTVVLTRSGDLVIGFPHDVAVFRRQPHPASTGANRSS